MRSIVSKLGFAAAIAALLLPAALDAAKPPQQELRLSAQDPPEASFRRGDLRVSAETGVPLALYRVGYKVAAGSPETMARQFLADHAGLFKLADPTTAELVHKATRVNPAGTTVRFIQHHLGIPVYDSEIAITIGRNDEVRFVMNGSKPNLGTVDPNPAVAAGLAHQQVVERLGIAGELAYVQTSLVVFRDAATTHLAWQVKLVPRTAPHGDFLGLVDAHDGALLRIWDKAAYVPVNGSGNVFDPDPLSSAQVSYNDPGYTDGGDADTAQLTAQVFSKTLFDIDLTAGMHTLRGPFADIRDTESPFLGLFSQAGSSFAFTRNASAFEAAHTYFHLDNVMRYLNVTLGLSIMPFQYSGGARFDPHGLSGADNSHYIGSTGEVAFGEGGVDDAEDADVVIHELGHGLHDWATVGGLSQVNGLSEGIGDFVAQSYSRSLNQWTVADPEYNWVFHWDGHNPFWGGRRTNYSGHYPEDLVGQVHTDGQIWSTCMMQVWDALGRDATERAHWSGIAMTTGSTNQADAAQAVLDAAVSLGYPSGDVVQMEAIFDACGYDVTAALPPLFADGFESGNTSEWSATVP